MTYASNTALSVVAALLIFSTAHASNAHAQDTASLSLKVSDIETPTGKMMIALFNTEQGWAENTPVKTQMIDVNADTFSTAFSSLEPGQYGIKIFHDENANGKLDLGFMGKPKEPYAFSNDAPARFGPPKWDAARFDIKAGENAQLVHLK